MCVAQVGRVLPSGALHPVKLTVSLLQALLTLPWFFHRKRAKTTLVWREMRSPPCWKIPCLLKSKCVHVVVCVRCENRHLQHLPGSRSRLVMTSLPPVLRSTVLQQQCNKVGKVETGSVALPAIMRSGAGGPESFQMGSMPQAKQHVTSGQMHRGHMPPLVGVQGRQRVPEEVLLVPPSLSDSWLPGLIRVLAEQFRL